MAAQSMMIALAGNPNVGKSSIFNALTGSRQHVGNWPGKTVEKKEGILDLDGEQVVVVDLPGTYSLTAYSVEEIISRDFIINQHPGLVIAVVDAANLERNLYLVTQLLELNTPLVIALNMADIARKHGIHINPAVLSNNLGGVPIIETIGSRGIGIDSLKTAIKHIHPHNARLHYGDLLEAEIATLQRAILAEPGLGEYDQARWLAVKLLEDDQAVVTQFGDYPDLLTDAQRAIKRIEAVEGEDAETLITDARYTFISRVVSGAIRRPDTDQETTSDKIDKLMTHRVWGLPVFLLMMWVVFQFTANVSAPFLDWIDGVISGPLTRWIIALMDIVNLNGTWIESLLVNGVIAGVGGVLVFVPVLTTLYFAIALLEDSGYMARAAFVMDRVMRLLGLHGKSFLPMLVGFGCTVPAVYATRTLENEDDRKLTGFLVTFMSCGARLPVYVMIGSAFFGSQSGNLIFGMYILGILVALFTGFMMKRTVYRNKPPQPFVMELPPYRVPRLQDVWRQTWERTSSFIRNATTIILAVSVLIWFLLATPVTNGSFNNVEAEDSLYGTVSQMIAPVFTPAGFGQWEAAGSLISGFVAKEVVIGTMNLVFIGEEEPAGDTPTLRQDLGEIGTTFTEAAILTGQEIVNIIPRTVNLLPVVNIPEANFLGTGDDADDTTALERALTASFSPLAAIAFTVFVLLYTPCMSTVAAMRHEFGTRFMLYQVGYTAFIAWLAAVIVFQVGTLLGIGV